jgi:ribosomal protein S18 acetylase RimI-like enzyme
MERAPVKLSPPFRPATPNDAAAMADFVNFAGEGMPLYLWTKMAEPGEDPWAVGRRRARREEGAFSYRNTLVVEEGGRVSAALIGYPLPDVPEPFDPASMPAMFVGLQELENLAPKTWYVNVVAAYPEHRGKGLGTRLLVLAENLARETRCDGLSIIVADTNVGARRLYERSGYREIARRPAVKEDWDGAASEWVLLVKAI